jgi:hypothetical protein
VTAQGQPLIRFARAVEGGNVFLAELAAKEAGYLPLREALTLVRLYAFTDSPKFERAAVRWLARLALETDDLTLADVQLAAGALAALPRREEAALRVLADLCRHSSG